MMNQFFPNDPFALPQANPMAMQVPITQPAMQVAEPTLSQKLLNAGVAMAQADAQGMGTGGSIAAGLKGYADTIEQAKQDARKERLNNLAEYELMGRIRERQMTSLQQVRRMEAMQELAKTDPQFAQIAEVSPEAAEKYLLEKLVPKAPEYKEVGGQLYKIEAGKDPVAVEGVGGKSGPFEGTGMDAQVTNILLTGDPSTPDYLAAYNIASQPRVTVGQDGVPVTVTPNMSAYRKPLYGQQVPIDGAMPVDQTDPALTTGDAGGIKFGDPTNFSGDKLKAAGFASRMVNSDEILSTLPEGSEKGKTGWAGRAEAVLSAIPSAGLTDALGKGIVWESATPEQQQYLNAAQEWIRAKLRRESGAVIGAQEMIDEYSTYYPVVGDSEEVMKQKKTLREAATKAMVAESGGGYEFINKDAGVYEAAPVNGDPLSPKTKAEFDAIPSGARFIHPKDGKVRIKP